MLPINVSLFSHLRKHFSGNKIKYLGSKSKFRNILLAEKMFRSLAICGCFNNSDIIVNLY